MLQYSRQIINYLGKEDKIILIRDGNPSNFLVRFGFLQKISLIKKKDFHGLRILGILAFCGFSDSDCGF